MRRDNPLLDNQISSPSKSHNILNVGFVESLVSMLKFGVQLRKVMIDRKDKDMISTTKKAWPRMDVI